MISLDAWPKPSVVDIAAAVVVLLSAVRGFLRGLSGELAHLTGTLAALAFGLYAYRPFAGWLAAHTRLSGRPAQGLGFVAIALAAILVMFTLRYVLKRVMRIVIEERFDKGGGLVAGLVRSCLFVALVFIAMNLVPHAYLNRKFGEESMVGRALGRWMTAVGDPDAAGSAPDDRGPKR